MIFFLCLICLLSITTQLFQHHHLIPWLGTSSISWYFTEQQLKFSSKGNNWCTQTCFYTWYIPGSSSISSIFCVPVNCFKSNVNIFWHKYQQVLCSHIRFQVMKILYVTSIGYQVQIFDVIWIEITRNIHVRMQTVSCLTSWHAKSPILHLLTYLWFLSNIYDNHIV